MQLNNELLIDVCKHALFVNAESLNMKTIFEGN